MKILIFTVMLAIAQSGQQIESSSSNKYHLPECTVVLIEDVDLPALESGQLTEIAVKPGMSVTKGQNVAQMDDKRSQRALEEATLRHQVANDQANDSTEVDAAYKRAVLAKKEYEKTIKLRRTGSMSEQQAERSRVSAEIARLEYEGAKKARELAAVQAAAEMVTVQASQDSINRHALKSPIDGVVYEVNRDAGEWVTAGETVMKIARMDKLRITRLVDGDKFDQNELMNRKVTAKVVMARGQEIEFSGAVVFASPQKRLGNKYMVWAEVENRVHPNSNQHWLLQPGSVVEMTIHLDQSVAQSADRNISNSATRQH